MNDKVPPTVGEVLVGVLADLIAYERAKKSAMEARGLAVITSSGTLVTLILALAAVVTSLNDFRPSGASRWLFALSALLIVGAAGLGVYCNSPTKYLDFDTASLRSLIDPHEWSTPGPDAARQVAESRISILADMRDRTERKAAALAWGAGLQVAGIVLLALAVVGILVGG